MNRTQAAADAATAFMNEQAASAGTAELSQGDFLPKEIQAIRWRPKEQHPDGIYDTFDMYTGDGKCTPFINPEWLEFKLGYEFTRNAVRISKQTEQLYNTKKIRPYK